MTRSTGVVLGRSGSRYRVRTASGETAAVLRGKLKTEEGERVIAGDVVDLELSNEGPAAICRLHRRKSVLARREPGTGPRRAQAIAANVDQVVVVAAASDPEPNLRMLDRFLVIAEGNGLPAAVVVNKIELEPAAGDGIERRYAPAGYQVLRTAAKAGEGLPALRDLLRGRTSVLCGPSGAGKSSLLNALQPGLKLRVGEISAKWRTGRHTTVSAELLPLEIGGYVVDTPGIREVGAWGIDPNSLGACFPEFRRFLDRCRFDDCRHLAEPECAVRRAAQEGAFDADRLTSYARLYEEVSLPSWSSGRRHER